MIAAFGGKLKIFEPGTPADRQTLREFGRINDAPNSGAEWSRDGGTLLVARVREEVGLYDLASEEYRTLAHADYCSPAWLGDGRRLLLMHPDRSS